MNCWDNPRLHTTNASTLGGGGLTIVLCWPTCGTPVQNDTRQDFLRQQHSLLSPIICIYFAPPPSLNCAQHVYIHTYLTVCRLCMNYRRYQITLQWNIFTQTGAVRSVDWIFIVGATAWRWLGEYVALGRTFYSLLLVNWRIREIWQSSFGNWANT